MTNNQPDCSKCPSFLTPEQSAESSAFRRSIGVPMCKRYGKPLSTQNQTPAEQTALRRHLAEKCDAYGMAAPVSVSWSAAQLRVLLPFTSDDPQESPNLVTSCAQCAFFISQRDVFDHWGFQASACAAKGKLLLSNRFVVEARSCPHRSLGSRNYSFDNLFLLPEYSQGFFAPPEVNLVDMIKKLQEGFVDPKDYPTDREVSPGDQERGIRAWRKVSDYSDTDRFVFLPIYRREYFDETQQSKIPQTGDDEHPEDFVDYANNLYTVAVLWTELDETPAFWGQPGIGKTEFFRYIAWLMQLPFERFSITHSTELDDLAGKMHYTEGVGTHFEPGRLVRAWESPCVIVIDEPNAGPRDVWEFLRPMTDNSKQLVLDQAAGELSVRHTDCYLGLAMNPAWDSLNIGTQSIADADANRLQHIEVDLPSEELEREILRKRCIRDGWQVPEEVLDLVMNVADDLRKMVDSQTIGVSWALRPQLKVVRALRWFDPVKAYRLAIADFLEPAQREVVIETVMAHHTEWF